MEYKYELHCHTDEVSRCASCPAARMVEIYKEKGYSGMVVTDHYSPLTFLDRHLFAPQQGMISPFFSEWNSAFTATVMTTLFME